MSIHQPWSAESYLRRQRDRLKNIFTCVTVKPSMVHIYHVIVIFPKTHIFAALSISMEKDIYFIINTEDFLFARIREKTYVFEKTHWGDAIWLRGFIVIKRNNSDNWQPAEAQQIYDYPSFSNTDSNTENNMKEKNTFWKSIKKKH